MPIIKIYSPKERPNKVCMYEAITELVTEILGLPSDNCWIIWQKVSSYRRASWDKNEFPGPVINVICKETHSDAKIEQILEVIKAVVSKYEKCKPEDIYISVQEVSKRKLLLNNKIWKGE